MPATASVVSVVQLYDGHEVLVTENMKNSRSASRGGPKGSHRVLSSHGHALMEAPLATASATSTNTI